MSLLIKGLDTAEKNRSKEERLKAGSTSRRKAQNLLGGASADQQPDNLTEAFYSESAEDSNKARANNVFHAKQLPVKEVNPMAWILGLGLLALLSLGAYFYYQLNKLQSPKRPAVIATASQVAAPAIQEPIVSPEQKSTDTPIVESTVESKTVDAAEELSVTERDDEASAEDEAQLEEKAALTKKAKKSIFKKQRARRVVTKKTARPSQPVLTTEMFNAPAIESESASIEIIKTRKSRGIQPALLDAYDAYNQGRDQDAQSLYRTVLQRDIRSVDALLGMGAIAERQGRLQDAQGWYQKVLEVEPRNPVALSAYYDQQLQAENKEQKLKTLIAKEPNSANANADLATYYADKQQWGLAQQSYFEAYRLNKSAENALNLAVSLDQLGKSNIALNYYKEALAQSDNAQNKIDQAAIAARIEAIGTQ